MTDDRKTDDRPAPGRETDRLVAERFVGWHLEFPPRVASERPRTRTHWHDRRGVFTGWATENCCWAEKGMGMCDVFSPSTESRHAVEIVLSAAARRGLIYRMAQAGAEAVCDLISADGEPLSTGRGETMAMAICRAVLGLPEEGGPL